MKIFTMLDSGAETYAPPTVSASVTSFTRDVGLALKNPPQQPTPFHTYPEQFRLYYIGDFDPVTGVISAQESPQFLGLASDYLSPVASAA